MAATNPTRRRLPALRPEAQVELALRRLSRFARLEHEYGAQLNDAGLRLLRASTFSAYCDCRALGVTDRAVEALRAAAAEAIAAETTVGAAPVGAAP